MRGAAPAPAGDVETTLYLIGDAGAPDARFEPVLAALATDVATNPAATVVAFLGDNVYPAGLPPGDDPGRAEAERRLRAQVRAVVESGGEAVFLPGNHDWNHSGSGGLERVREQERLVETWGGGRVRFLPDGGCPGPAVLEVGEQLRLVALDTQWWLQDPEKRDDGTPCPARSEAAVTAQIEQLLAGSAGRHTVVLGHHPLRSGGPHGGHFTLSQHLFPLRELAGWAWLPLPVIGSLYPLARSGGLSDQDVGGGRNRRMRAALEAAFRAGPPLVYASGHEHSLQVLEGTSARWLVVSGGGMYGHATPVRRVAGTLFAAGRSGYVRIDVERGGRVRLAAIEVDARGEGRAVFTRELTAGT